MVKNKKIGVISLGCDKNRVDTEKMLAVLSTRHKLVSSIEEAEIIIQEDAMERFREQVSSAMKSPNFGNARYVKNAVEEISENAVLRAWQGEDIQPEIEIQDVEKYIVDSEKSKISERKIGFN